MLVYGDSYLVTLSHSIVMPDGSWKQSIHGDFKGITKCEQSDTKYYQFGDVFVKVYDVRGYVKSEKCYGGKVTLQTIIDGEVLDLLIDNPIAKAHLGR